MYTNRCPVPAQLVFELVLTNHRRDARKNPRKYSFKKNMTIEVFEELRGLTDDEMHYHERRIFDKLKEEGHKLRYLQEPMGYPKINVLVEKYCS